MSLGEEVEVKKVGAHHPKDIQITQKEKRQNRSFCVTWFERKDWLMARLVKKSLFCFPCLLFRGDTAWTEQGVAELLFQ